MIFMKNTESQLNQKTSNSEGRFRRFANGARGLLAMGMTIGVLNSGAQQTNSSSSTPEFGAFQIITQRNIFDPNRRSGIVRDDRPRTHETPRTVDSFALVGTMSYPKGKFAFFDGSSSQYKKVLEPGANIAGYTVKDISGNAVTLAANGKEFQMKVGAQLRNQGDNKWQLSTHADEPANPEPNSESNATASSTLPPGSSPEMSEVLKRLMQNRQQELK
jgi:hypothetical protein